MFGGERSYHVGPNGPSQQMSVPPGFEGKTPTSNPNLVEAMPRSYFYYGVPGSPPWLRQAAQQADSLSSGSQNLLQAFQMMMNKPQMGAHAGGRAY
jgi:hypothetical protein